MAQLMRQRRKQGRYKHDGYRTVPVVERGSARAYTRNGHDCSYQAAQSGAGCSSPKQPHEIFQFIGCRI